MVKSLNTLPAGHVMLPAATISALSVLLAVGLEILRVLDRLDALASRLVLQGGVTSFPNVLPLWIIWISTVLLAFGLAAAILSVPGTWRRVILWISTLAMVVGWGPVLSLAAYSPDVGAPFVGVLWAGLCASVYSYKHRMAADEAPVEIRS